MLCKGIVEKKEKCFVEIKLGRNKDKMEIRSERSKRAVKNKRAPQSALLFR